MNWLKKNWIIVVLILGVAYYFFVYKKQNTEKVDDVADDNPVNGQDVNSDPNEEPTSDVVRVKPAPFAITDIPTLQPVGVGSTIKPTPFVITDIPTLQLIKESLNKQPTVTAFSRNDKVSLFGGKKWKN